MQKAVEWGIAAFQAAGADSVHTEDFFIQASWAEGATRMTVTAPGQFALRAVSIAWAPALAAHSHVQVIDLAQGTENDFAKAGNIAGAILLVHSDEMHKWADLFAEYLKAPGIIDRAVKGKALAIAFQSTVRMTCCIVTPMQPTAKLIACPCSWSRARMPNASAASWPRARNFTPTSPSPTPPAAPSPPPT
jgi:hypothetical protein